MSIITLPTKGGEAMSIHWFEAKEREGQASLTCHYITLNTVASVPFQYAYKVQVGLNEEGNLVIEPLPKKGLSEAISTSTTCKTSPSRRAIREFPPPRFSATSERLPGLF